MSTKTKLIIALIGIIVCIIAFFMYPKEFLFAVGGLLLVFVFAVGLRKKRQKYRGRYYYEDSEDWEAPSGEIHIYHHKERQRRRITCPECDGTGRVERRLMPIQRGAPGISDTKTCPLCRGRRWVWD